MCMYLITLTHPWYVIVRMSIVRNFCPLHLTHSLVLYCRPWLQAVSQTRQGWTHQTRNHQTARRWDATGYVCKNTCKPYLRMYINVHTYVCTSKPSCRCVYVCMYVRMCNVLGIDGLYACYQWRSVCVCQLLSMSTVYTVPIRRCPNVALERFYWLTYVRTNQTFKWWKLISATFIGLELAKHANRGCMWRH